MIRTMADGQPARTQGAIASYMLESIGGTKMLSTHIQSEPHELLEYIGIEILSIHTEKPEEQRHTLGIRSIR